MEDNYSSIKEYKTKPKKILTLKLWHSFCYFPQHFCLNEQTETKKGSVMN
jgi:hypothetical protein